MQRDGDSDPAVERVTPLLSVGGFFWSYFF